MPLLRSAVLTCLVLILLTTDRFSHPALSQDADPGPDTPLTEAVQPDTDPTETPLPAPSAELPKALTDPGAQDATGGSPASVSTPPVSATATPAPPADPPLRPRASPSCGR